MFLKKNSPTEKILLLGLGGIGFYLAKRLANEEYAVTVIERDAKIIAQAEQQFDARFIKGDAMSMACWHEAGVEGIDYLIAVTNDDTVNMMASLIASKFGITQKVVRIRSQEFGKKDSVLTGDDLKIDLSIHPEELAAQEIVRLIERTASQEIISIADEEIELLATKLSSQSPWAYKTLKEIAQIHNSFYFRVVAIARGVQTIIPQGDDELLPDDHISIMVRAKNMSKLMDLTNITRKQQHRVLLLGGGLVGLRVAKLLENSVQVTLLEQNEARAQELSNTLPNTLVLHGDASNGEVLMGAGLFRTNTMVSLTGANETNIMASLLAKHLISQQQAANKKTENTRTISLVNKEDYLVLAATTGSDIAINKKVMAANEILKYIRRQDFQAVAHLHGFDAEVVELIAKKKSTITQKPLSKLDQYYQEKLIVGAVYYDGEGWRIGVGDMHIEAGQRVIVLCASRDLKIIRKIFSS